ncbi:MAG: hypothetical protein WD512_18875 [Candidatus Paceibacterota bacterium]
MIEKLMNAVREHLTKNFQDYTVDVGETYVRVDNWERGGSDLEAYLFSKGFYLDWTEDEDRGVLYDYQLGAINIPIREGETYICLTSNFDLALALKAIRVTEGDEQFPNEWVFNDDNGNVYYEHNLIILKKRLWI